MKLRIAGVVLIAALAAACSREPPTEGNGPGNADGVGGREDPATTPPVPVTHGQNPSNELTPTPAAQEENREQVQEQQQPQ